MAIYLKADDIKGSVSTNGYKNWIHINELEFAGIANPTRIKVGQAMDRNLSQPNFGQVIFMKPMDSSTVAFFEAAHSGKVFKQMEFDYVSAGDQPKVYGKVVLSNAVVTHYSDKHSDSLQRPMELIRVSYSKIEKTVIAQDVNNKPMSPMTTGYDLEQAAGV